MGVGHKCIVSSKRPENQWKLLLSQKEKNGVISDNFETLVRNSLPFNRLRFLLRKTSNKNKQISSDQSQFFIIHTLRP